MRYVFYVGWWWAVGFEIDDENFGVCYDEAVDLAADEAVIGQEAGDWNFGAGLRTEEGKKFGVFENFGDFFGDVLSYRFGQIASVGCEIFIHAFFAVCEGDVGEKL